VKHSRLWDAVILSVASLTGMVAFFYPFFTTGLAQTQASSNAHAQDAPLITVVLIALCLATVLANLGSGEMNSKMVAILGVLTAANAVLRAVPGPAGFSLVFMLPVLCGYAYGPVFGFLLGALSLLVSAIIGAGIGPWLPYQMFATGWVGLTSSWLPDMRRWGRVEVIALGIWGVFWGFFFGAVMNIWFWPFVFQPQQANSYCQPGMGLAQTLKHYAVFYGLTSFWWDLGRAIGNALLIGMFGAPILKLLRRYQRRFHFVSNENHAVDVSTGVASEPSAARRVGRALMARLAQWARETRSILRRLKRWARKIHAFLSRPVE